MQVQNFKEKLTEILGRLDEAQVEDEDSVDEASVAKLFEEVKVMFQDLPSRIDRRLDPDKRRFRRFHPMMLDEAMHVSSQVGDPIGLLMITSLFRDDLPWLYELGLEAYRAIRRGRTPEIRDAVMRMQVSIDFARHSHFMASIRDKELYYFVRELPMLIDRFIPQEISIVDAAPAKAAKKGGKSGDT
jgi:hypothetical protein